MTYPNLYLKKNEGARLRRGHLWIFSNEVDVHRSPLSGFAPGDIAHICSHDGKPVGIAYVNPNTLICARLLSRKSTIKIGPAFFKNRFGEALNLRSRLFDKPYYRLVFGESDGLPGLVIDRFGEVLSVQVATAGMERQQQILIDVLQEMFAPKAIVLKNTSSQRRLEGLECRSEIVAGELPDPVTIEENGAKFKIDVLGGQKTGWFFDHRLNRAQTARLASGMRVLDLFSYSGAWGVPAAMAGAESVTCVDGSQSALALAAENAVLNGVGDRLHCVQSDAFDFLKQARDRQERFDIVILDPPALIKRRKDFKQGFEAYRRLNHLALQVLSREGFLVSASCSQHLSRDNLLEILRSSARHIDRHIRLIGQGSQGPDHPIHPAIPESEYLKIYFCAVSASL
ncbi:MAG: class I SAM-dependent rRNA methyltransferase [Gammaproteobacteria bacterium]